MESRKIRNIIINFRSNSNLDEESYSTLYFDDFESRSLSYIGVLTSPYTPPEPSVAPA